MAPSSHTVASDTNLPRAVSVADDHEWLRHASRRPRRALEALTTTTTQRTIMKARARASRMRTTSYVARRGGVDDVEWTTRSEARGGWGVEGPKPRPRARARDVANHTTDTDMVHIATTITHTIHELKHYSRSHCSPLSWCRRLDVGKERRATKIVARGGEDV